MRLFTLVIFSAVVCVSCSTTTATRASGGGSNDSRSSSPSVKKKASKNAPLPAVQELRGAEANAKSGDSKRAVARLKKLLQQYPDYDISGDIHFDLGNISFAQNQFVDALANYRAVVESPIASPFENDARIRAAKSLNKLSRPEEAEKMLSGPWPTQLTHDQNTEATRARSEALLAQKKNIPALEAMIALADQATVPAERDRLRNQAQDMLDSRITEAELKEISSSSRFSFVQAPAKYRYALVLADQHEYGRARSALADVVQLAPGSELSARATKLIEQIDARNRVDAKTIGVVLPLTGKQAATGNKVLHAIQLGLGIYGPKPSGFRLAVVDSEGTPDGGRRAVERLVQEDNVIAIIGGLLSKSATAEAAKAQEFGVPTILLSQKSGITKAGESIFRNALTSQMQVQQLVDVAMDELGMKSFVVVYPNDLYGVEYANIFWDEVKARGGDIVGAQSYDADAKDLSAQVQRVAGTFFFEDRSDEYHQRLKQFQDKNPKRSVRQTGPSIEDILPPIVDFDGVFIPDGAGGVGQLAPAFAYNNVRGIRFLGTNLWNTGELIRRAGRAVEGSVFVDSVLISDPTFKASEFYTSFKSTFDEEPGINEIQAYDSATILRSLIGGGETTRVGLQGRMASLQNFPGALGPLSINGEREFRRPTTTLTIKSGAIVPMNSITK